MKQVSIRILVSPTTLTFFPIDGVRVNVRSDWLQSAEKIGKVPTSQPSITGRSLSWTSQVDQILRLPYGIPMTKMHFIQWY